MYRIAHTVVWPRTTYLLAFGYAHHDHEEEGCHRHEEYNDNDLPHDVQSPVIHVREYEGDARQYRVMLEEVLASTRRGLDVGIELIRDVRKEEGG